MKRSTTLAAALAVAPLALTLAVYPPLSAFLSPANAHGIWVAERWGDLGIVYGHGASDDPYDPGKIKRVVVLDEEGSQRGSALDSRENHALITADGEPAVVVVDFDNGFYSKGPDGKWVNKPKSAVPGALKGGRYLKHAISLLHLHDDIPALPAQSLQILPLSNPTSLAPGERFRVRVLFEGKSLAGVELIGDYVNLSGSTQGTTDAVGEAELVVRNDGLNVVAVKHEVMLESDPDADLRQHFATLSFIAEQDHNH